MIITKLYEMEYVIIDLNQKLSTMYSNKIDKDSPKKA